MKTHIKFPKIQQFRNVVSEINRKVCFVGLDKDGNPIYDQSISKPNLTFKGTVKLHGSNSSVCFNTKDGFWVQSRQNIITVENDNYDFALFAEKNQFVFMIFFEEIAKKHNIDLSKFTLSIYGEWAGKGIQKSVGISEIEKSFFIFGVKVSNKNDDDFKSFWLPFETLKSTENRIFNVSNFETYEVAVDFNMPQLAQNTFAEITQKVEAECPIAKSFGIKNGLGEGVVWTVSYKGENYRFKVKGEKHSVTKVKKLASVDIEKLKSITAFVNYAVTKNRFSQALENVFGKEDIDIKKMGELIRWLVNDIAAEETDTLEENNLVAKDVNKYISLRVRELFFEEMNKF